jgi:anti-sigma factor RsiW
MSSCSSIDPLVTPYVDGEIGPADRQIVVQHLDACAPCRARVAAEQVVHDLMRERKRSMCADGAPAMLRTRCAALAHLQTLTAREQVATPVAGRTGRSTHRRAAWRGRLAPLAVAASLVLLVGGSFLYQATQSSSRVMAAELAADHMRCFAMNAVLGTHQSADTVQSSMASGFGWNMQLPQGSEREGLELVGSRPCLYGEGKVAHIMYRHNGQPVSLFMLPRSQRSEQLVEVFGHECAIWSSGDRTFVLVAREARSDVERLAAFVHGALREPAVSR